LPFLLKLVEKVIEAGATIINIPDTVGYSMPDEFGAFIRAILDGVPNMDKAVLSVHCHNDLGVAVANTLAAIKQGARQAEVTINGLGERAGNAALEEVVMSLQVRKDLLPFECGINTKQIFNTSRLVSTITGLQIARNKPIIGENAFAHESGIHQDGVLKFRQTYEIMTPDAVGREASAIVLGRHSGMHGFRKRMEELGLSLSEEETASAYKRFLDISDRKKEVYDEDLYAIVSDELGRENPTFTLEYFNITSGNMAVPTATVRIVKDGEAIEEAATGDGPVDAIFRAIDRIIEIPAILREYAVQAVTPGRQAMGEVSVILEIKGSKVRGRSSSTDILEASANAYVNALNRYKVLVEKK
ncbi:MAG: 2-isopropylmalate synthase, partial [Spirochaetales bacterium]